MNALAQYQVLLRLAHAEVVHTVEAVRTAILQIPSSETSLDNIILPVLERLPQLSSKMPIFERDYLNAQGSTGHTLEQKPGEQYERPSAYLRSWCAACFGGTGGASSLGDGMLVCTLFSSFA